jgi:hypothetical protein
VTAAPTGRPRSRRGGTRPEPVRRLAPGTVEAGGLPTGHKETFSRRFHSAAPTFFAWFSFRHRNRPPFKYTWAVIAFLATQTIIAMMFLRWHYLIDIIAGLATAGTPRTLGHSLRA